MRRPLILATLCLVFPASVALGDEEPLIGQLQQNSSETGTRSNAQLNQIGKRTVESGGLVDQIDPSQVVEAAAAANRDDRVDVSVGIRSGDCAIGQDQEAILNYLRMEGRVFENNCELLDWLEGGNSDEPTDREIFETLFGTEAQRLQQVEQQRLEQEQAEAEARARILEAVTAPPSDS